MRERAAYERRMQALGACTVCGDVRDWTVTNRMPYGSRRFCRKHREKNREYVRACRQRKRAQVMKVAA